jgi:hypothetical protein
MRSSVNRKLGRMRLEVRRAKADPPLPRAFIFYSLRHYFISRQLLAGANIHILAKNACHGCA